jgi:hypothetical protein
MLYKFNASSVSFNYVAEYMRFAEPTHSMGNRALSWGIAESVTRRDRSPRFSPTMKWPMYSKAKFESMSTEIERRDVRISLAPKFRGSWLALKSTPSHPNTEDSKTNMAIPPIATHREDFIRWISVGFSRCHHKRPTTIHNPQNANVLLYRNKYTRLPSKSPLNILIRFKYLNRRTVYAARSFQVKMDPSHGK